MRRYPRWRALMPAALTLAFLVTPAAHAELEIGAEAVDVSAQEYVNIEPVKLVDLSGRLILLELWKTT
jgi:hypothetical protein